MENKEKIKIGILSALVPTAAAAALAGSLAYLIKNGGKKSNKWINQKAREYARLADSAPKGATVFFGDSITEICNLDEVYAEYIKNSGVPVVNRGISGETTDSMLARVNESVIALKPRNLVMLMGVNDLNRGVGIGQISDNVRQIIRLVKEKSPQTNIVLEAVYPTDSDKLPGKNPMINGRETATIQRLNGWLRLVAQEENVRFLDLSDVLSDETGDLRGDYTYDGLHPNLAGFIAARDRITAQLL